MGIAGMETKNDIFSQRLIIAVLWNIGLQTTLAVVLVFVLKTDLLHPLLWITSTIQEILGWKMALNIVLLATVSFFHAYIYGSYYMTPLPKHFTRFSMFLNMYSVQNAMFSILYALSGYFTMGLYSSLAKSNFHILKKSCIHFDGQCLMEKSLLLQIGGMWMGLFYFLNIHIFGTSVLMFSHVSQDRFYQIKLATTQILALGFKTAVMPVFYYCLFYYLWGNKLRSVVSDVYGIYLEDPPLDNMWNLIKSCIWVDLWFYTSLYFVSVYMMRVVFNVILTEPMKFPIVSDTSLTLCDALSQKKQFNGYLGAQDLKIMAMTDPSRRALVFTLSQPGGHPRNWTNLLERCLSTLNEFSKELDNISSDAKPVEEENSFHRKLKYTPVSPNIRNLASPDLLGLKDENRNRLENTFANVIKEEFNILLQKISQKPGINYFFGELTDTKLKYLLLQSQPVMWTCEGLAFITAASLTEDKYGVVQNNLPVVLSALINLKQNLEKLTKPGLVPRRHILNDVLAIKMRSALMSSVKRSIYKIVLTFSKYMHELPLEPEIKIAIQPFLLCKEA